MKMALLDIHKLDAGYGHHQVLKDVSISLEKGDLAVIIGPNGSGKSTTVKSVFGLTTHFSGKISFDGKDLAGKPTHWIVRLGIGYVPQGRLVFDSLTVEENLQMGAFDSTGKGVKAQRMRRMLKMFPVLREKLSHQASFLSGGQQQMLSIARALMREPKLLLLDEPSLGLDPRTQKLIFSTVKRINSEGVTVMMVEQNAKQALAICTKAYVVENGRIAAHGGPELARKKRIQELYLGG